MKKFLSFLLITVICISMIISSVSADGTDYVKLAAGKFKDLKSTDWYVEYVGKLNQLQIIDGYNGKFDPAGNVTRAQFIKMLVQAMNYKKVDSISFFDIKPLPSSKPHWSAVYIETALRNGVIVKEEIGENFYPDVPLNRLDMAFMICRALKLPPSVGENPFADMAEPNGYVVKLYEEYLIRGSVEQGKRLYKADALTSRAEAAAILARLMDYKADPEAYKANMKAEELKTATKANGVPLRLYEYKNGTKGRTFKECFEEYYNFIRYRGEAYVRTNGYIYPEIATFGGSDAFLKYQVDLVKRYMKYNFNVDYRTVGDDYIKGIGDTLGTGVSFTLNKNIENFKKYKVVCKSEFLTDYDLIFIHESSTVTVRGTLRIKFESPTSSEFAKKYGVEVGKWYELDMDITLGRDSVDKTWNVYRDNSFKYLTDPVLLNK